MISFPLFYIAIPFLILIGVWITFAFFNILHTLKFGFVNYISYFMTFIFLGATVIVFFLTWEALAAVDWYEVVTINSQV